MLKIGNPLNKKGSDNDYGVTEDPYECQRKCQETNGCYWFNWDSNKPCFLKEQSGAEERVEKGGATGPRSCNGKYKSLKIG